MTTGVILATARPGEASTLQLAANEEACRDPLLQGETRARRGAGQSVSSLSGVPPLALPLPLPLPMWGWEQRRQGWLGSTLL